MTQPINIALVGASGVVGTKIMQLLEKKAFPINNFYPLGS
jgi:aspartate-semialdehyde dehydrogenase